MVLESLDAHEVTEALQTKGSSFEELDPVAELAICCEEGPVRASVALQQQAYAAHSAGKMLAKSRRTEIAGSERRRSRRRS